MAIYIYIVVKDLSTYYVVRHNIMLYKKKTTRFYNTDALIVPSLR